MRAGEGIAPSRALEKGVPKCQHVSPWRHAEPLAAHTACPLPPPAAKVTLRNLRFTGVQSSDAGSVLVDMVGVSRAC